MHQPSPHFGISPWSAGKPNIPPALSLSQHCEVGGDIPALPVSLRNCSAERGNPRFLQAPPGASLRGGRAQPCAAAAGQHRHGRGSGCQKTLSIFSVLGSRSPNLCSFFLQLKHPRLKCEENRASLVIRRKGTRDLACTRGEHTTDFPETVAAGGLRRGWASVPPRHHLCSCW